MKIKIKRQQNGQWLTQLNKGNGGVSSLVCVRQHNSFLKSISVLFSLKNLIKAI